MNYRFPRIVIWFALCGLLTILVYTILRIEIEPVWLLAGVVGLGAAIYLMRCCPYVLVAGLLFVGAFKTVPAEDVSLSDPTLILLLLTAAAMFIEFLFMFIRARRVSVADAFAGQGQAVLAYFVFVAVLAASYSYTPAGTAGGMKLLRFVIFESVAFFAPFFLLKSERDLKRFLGVILLLSLVLGAKIMFGIFGGEVRTTAEGFAADVTDIGSAQALGISVLALLYYKFVPRYSRAVTLFSLVFLSAAMVSAVARGPLIALALAAVLGLFVVRKPVGGFSRRQVAVGLVVIAVVIAVAVSLVEQQPAARARFGKKQRELKALLSGSAAPSGTTASRLEFYQTAVRLFSEKPVSGWGVGSWGLLYYGAERKLAYPHNIVLELAVEEGLMGLAAFAVLSLVGVRAVRRLLRSHPRYAFVVPIAAYCCLFSLFSGDIGNRTVWFWWGAIFAIARLPYLENKLSTSAFGPVMIRGPVKCARPIRSMYRQAPDAPIGALWKG